MLRFICEAVPPGGTRQTCRLMTSRFPQFNKAFRRIPIMTERYIFTADSTHLRGFREHSTRHQSTPTLIPVLTINFPSWRETNASPYWAQAGTHPGSRGNGATGLAANERLPVKEEHERRIATDIAIEINDFMLAHPAALWRIALPLDMEKRVRSLISDGVLRRMTACLPKNLAYLPPHELPSRFAHAAELAFVDKTA